MSALTPEKLVSLPITRVQLREMLDRVPRLSLAKLPTPLDEAPRFSKALGGPRILIKRDDLTGLALGGNKSRMLEFRMANAIKEGADCIVGGAAAQSNDCRQTSAAAAKLGLKMYLVLKEQRKRVEAYPQGNLLLHQLFGAEVTVIGRNEDIDQRQKIKELGERLRQEGHKPYYALDDFYLWAVGYVDCFLELYDQLDQLNVQPQHIYVCANLMSQSGLMVGKAAVGSAVNVVGINPGWHRPDTIQRLVDLANEAGRFLGLDVDFTAQDVANTDAYVGEGYGQPTEAGIEAIKLLARTEGILLDPVYTGKGMAGLIDHIRQGKIGKDETVVFIHTGGVPALFGYNEEIAKSL